VHACCVSRLREPCSGCTDVDNQSTVDLRELRSSLVQELHLRSHSGHSKHIRLTFARQAYPGVGPMTSAVGEGARHVPLPIAR
jgi:hypothetical protein